MQDQERTDVFENDIEIWLDDYCRKYGIENLRNESQNVWNGALMHVGKNLFAGSDILKDSAKFITGAVQPTTNNAYDIAKVSKVLNAYINLCYANDKEVSILGFAKLTCINPDTIHSWGTEGRQLGSTGSDIHKRLRFEREESLSAKLTGGKVNPVGILAILNHHYQWNLPGVSKEPARIQSRSPEEIAALYGSKLSDNRSLEALPDMPE